MPPDAPDPSLPPRRPTAMPSFLTSYPVPQWAAIISAGIGTLVLLVLFGA